jgi:hypothetical protein
LKITQKITQVWFENKPSGNPEENGGRRIRLERSFLLVFKNNKRDAEIFS